MPHSDRTEPSGTQGHARTHDAARWCAAQGWPVHPLAAGRKNPAANCPACKDQTHDPRTCPCRPAGRWCHGFHAATTDQSLIDAWWNTDPSFGVGVACGPASLLVIDIDAHPAQVPARDRLLPGIHIHDGVNLEGLASGYDTLALLAAYRRQPDPAADESTLRVRTPSGGLHVWYRTETAFRSSTGSSPKTALAWQVDVRAHGGYIIAPTTRTSAGTYLPLGEARQPALLPAWLAGELTRTGHRLAPNQGHQQVPKPVVVPTGRKTGTKTAKRVLEPLLEEVLACSAVPEGVSFTEKLNRAAFTAGGLVAAGHLHEQDALDRLTETADTARPRQQTRNAQIIASALAAGARRPLHLKGRP
ncbi:bifunctional DNA primase/polymerase [Kitasatospora sp. NPDC085895]|uniref:bifunctional DNA primase/polymerase n=1 Tax=Kitasatospora sp. NPDC085895 TaxID=3155057 RepID=UPI00344F932F